MIDYRERLLDYLDAKGVAFIEQRAAADRGAPAHTDFFIQRPNEAPELILTLAFGERADWRAVFETTLARFSAPTEPAFG